jgi:hypothetical protein
MGIIPESASDIAQILISVHHLGINDEMVLNDGKIPKIAKQVDFYANRFPSRTLSFCIFQQ